MRRVVRLFWHTNHPNKGLCETRHAKDLVFLPFHHTNQKRFFNQTLKMGLYTQLLPG